MVWLKVPSEPDRAHARRVGAAAFGVRIDRDFARSVGVVAAEGPIGKIAGRKIAVGDKIDRGVQGHDQSRRERAHIARAIGRGGGEALRCRSLAPRS